MTVLKALKLRRQWNTLRRGAGPDIDVLADWGNELGFTAGDSAVIGVEALRAYSELGDIDRASDEVTDRYMSGELATVKGVPMKLVGQSPSAVRHLAESAIRAIHPRTGAADPHWTASTAYEVAGLDTAFERSPKEPMRDAQGRKGPDPARFYSCAKLALDTVYLVRGLDSSPDMRDVATSVLSQLNEYSGCPSTDAAQKASRWVVGHLDGSDDRAASLAFVDEISELASITLDGDLAGYLEDSLAATRKSVAGGEGAPSA